MNTMKLTLPIVALAFGLGVSAQAESTLTLNGIHNCCKSCENGLTKAVSKIKDVTLTSTKTSVTITAKTSADAKKAATAIIDAGYYGTTGDEAKPAAATTPETKVKSATVTNVHMCCGKCAKAANEAIKSVAGITKGEAIAKETSFTVEGEFNASELVAALQKAGFNGKVK